MVYALQALSLFVGVTAIVGIIINYLKRDEAAGTEWQSHFAWQIRTFWWAVIGFTVSWPLILLLGLGFVTGFAVWVWYVYRIVRGFLAFNERRPLPQ
ncbi:hypothetical protein D3C86_2024090 [compost metagenome]